ncbi:MAG: occludin [Bacteroides sp.]|nr:occludin [Bacteroides sp.]
MKRAISILFLLMATWSAKAQEVATDTLGVPPADYIPPFELSADVKNYGGFLLDMGLMELAPTIPISLRPEMSYKDKSPDYNRLFKLNPNLQFSRGNYSLSGAQALGLSSFFATPTNLLMSSFKLKNGMRLNTYGQYNYKGYRQFDASALPWQRNNFKGAFELKSASGNFGIRVEVSRDR